MDKDIEIKLIRIDGEWRVRIGDKAIPELFETFDEVVAEAKKFLADTVYDDLCAEMGNRGLPLEDKEEL